MRVLLGVMVAILLAGLGSRVDFGFYNPAHGVASGGRDEVLPEPHDRELLHLTVTPADQKQIGSVPTVATLSAFYGVEDSLPCSVKRTFDGNDLKLADRPRPPGTVSTLCLD